MAQIHLSKSCPGLQDMPCSCRFPRPGQSAVARIWRSHSRRKKILSYTVMLRLPSKALTEMVISTIIGKISHFGNRQATPELTYIELTHKFCLFLIGDRLKSSHLQSRDFSDFSREKKKKRQHTHEPTLPHGNTQLQPCTFFSLYSPFPTNPFST